jgi:hypothetical protein
MTQCGVRVDGDRKPYVLARVRPLRGWRCRLAVGGFRITRPTPTGPTRFPGRPLRRRRAGRAGTESTPRGTRGDGRRFSGRRIVAALSAGSGAAQGGPHLEFLVAAGVSVARPGHVHLRHLRRPPSDGRGVARFLSPEHDGPGRGARAVSHPAVSALLSSVDATSFPPWRTFRMGESCVRGGGGDTTPPRRGRCLMDWTVGSVSRRSWSTCQLVQVAAHLHHIERITLRIVFQPGESAGALEPLW